jgi:hypothetical protein
MKSLGVLVIVMALLTVGYFLKQPTLLDNNNVESNQATEKTTNSQDPAASLHSHDHDHHSSGNAASQGSQTTAVAPGKTGNPHFDQLSPEMQQALKDSLLLEGPMETYKLKNGTVIMPAKDRFTQMPVAVQMPDGTIQIKEYSVIPRPKVLENK